MNWGNSIALVFVFFMAFILYLVYQTFQQSIDLVAPDYYEQEIAYQNVIDDAANYHKLEKTLTIKETEKNITIEFPHNKSANINGQVLFFRPSEQKKDLIIPVNSNIIIVNKKELLKGLYKIKATWMADSINYFNEQTHFVQ